MTQPKAHKYPKHRKKARRTKQSYIRKDNPLRQKRPAHRPKWKEPIKFKMPKFTGDLTKLNIIQFCEDVLGLSFKERPAQKVILKCQYALPLDDDEKEIYTLLTGNTEVFEPDIEKREALWCLGARSGKSTLVSAIAIYESVKDEWRQYLRPAEVAYCIIIATRAQQAADIIGRNCATMLESSGISHMVAESFTTSLTLTNGMRISSFPCNTSSVRGVPTFLLLFDEIAFYAQAGSPKAAELIYQAVRPRQSQFPNSKMFMISTPAGKSGLFWEEFSRGFKVPNRLTIQAKTRDVNPEILPEFIQREYERDPDAAETEYGAQFAETVSAYFPADKVRESLVLAGDLMPDSQYHYFLGIDQSGLSSTGDAFAAAVSHREGKKVIVDLTRQWSAGDSAEILGELAGIARRYNITTATCDRYAAGWIKEALGRVGLEAKLRERLPVIYQNMKSLLMAGLVHLPHNRPLSEGLLRTRAIYTKANNLSISHERTAFGHGDLADAVCTSVYESSSRVGKGFFAEALKIMEDRMLKENKHG